MFAPIGDKHTQGDCIMETPVIAVNCRKGGVGKTTTATHIAAGLARKGMRIGALDVDPQGHAALILTGLEDSNGLYDALIEHAPLDQVVVNPADNLYVIPGASRTAQIPHMLREDDSFAFVELCETFAGQYGLDAIVIDTPPTVSLLDAALMLAVDHFLYVTECERLSFTGVMQSITQMRRFGAQRQRYMGRSSNVLGIVPNKHRAGTVLHRHNIVELRNAFGDLVWTPVRLAVGWAEAANAGQLVFDYPTASGESIEAWRIVDNVMAGLGVVVNE
jgi:chromosome partitioning protein